MYCATHPNNSQDDERHQLNEDPGLVVLDIEEYRVLVAEGVD